MRRILISIVLAIALGAAGFMGWRALRPEASAGFADAYVGSTRLHLNQAFLRPGESIAAASVERLDLAARFPDFRPLSLDPPRIDNENAVFLSLRARDDSLDPGERLARLYARFLEKDQWTHPGGLIVRRFEPGSPYEREELYFAPPEGRLFSARCMRPAVPPDGLPDTCLSEVRMRGLDVQVRFAPELLADWERLMAGASGLIESMAR